MNRSKEIRFLLLFVCITMLTALVPSEVQRIWPTAAAKTAGAVGMQTESRVSAARKSADRMDRQQIAAVPIRGEREQFTLKEKGFERIAEITARGYYGNPRVMRVLRMLALPMADLFSEKPQRFKCFFSQGSRMQRELVPRSLQIVDFMCRADGKKNGIFSFIR